MKEPMVEMNFRPGMYDIDAMGIVSNITYVRWLEDLRLRFLDEYIPWERLDELGMGPVLAGTDIHYHKPLRLKDRARGLMNLLDMGRSSWELEFEFRRDSDGETVSTATQSGVFVDRETTRPRPLPEDLRNRLLNEKS